jgi:FkbM family methyltransferase
VAFKEIQGHEPWLVPYIPTQGELAIDVGANEGVWAVDLATAYGTVLAFEPNPETFARLCKRTENLINVQPYQAAVADTNEPQLLRVYARSVHDSLEEDVQSATSELLGRVLVPCIELDSIKFEHNVDFIKIDTEGGELRALLGMLGTIKRYLPALLVEYHTQQNLHDCMDVLGSLSYTSNHIPHPHGITGHGWIYAS